jgi:CHAT domain-containing protein/tetratricopeptide (TPR) repeat protein
MKQALIFCALALGLASGTAWPGCLSLAGERALSLHLSLRAAPCVMIKQSPGEATQISVSQPIDLAILVTGGTKRRADSFEIGPESITLTPGIYRIDIAYARHVTPRRPVDIVMSRKALRLQEAKNYIQAEDQGALAKESHDPDFIQRTAQLWSRLEDPFAMARFSLEVGDAYLDLGNLDSAFQSYEEGIRLCAAAKNARCSAEAANNSGYVEQQLGQFEAALDRLNEAERFWGLADNRELQGRTLSNIGMIHWQTGNQREAMATYDRAAELARNLDPLGYARILNNLGACYVNLGEYDKARGYFVQALPQFRAGRNPVELLRATVNLGRVYMFQGQTAAARAAFDEALKDAALQGASKEDLEGRALALTNIGELLVRAKSYRAAAAALNDALTINGKLGKKVGQAADLHYLGVAEASLGRLDAARGYLDRAIEIRRGNELHADLADSLFERGVVERSAGNAKAAREFAELALAQVQVVSGLTPGARLRASFLAQQRRLFDFLLDLTLASGAPRAAEDGFLLLEQTRGRALLDQLTEGSIFSQTPPELIARRNEIRKRLNLISGGLSSASVKQAQTMRSRADALVGQDGAIEARILESLKEQRLEQPLESVADLQRYFLPDDSAILEYHLGEERSHLWLITKDQVRLFYLPRRAIVEGQAKRAADLFNRYAERRESPAIEAAFDASLRDLSATLLSPLRGVPLPGRLILALDGPLYDVPFAALWMPSSDERLGLARDLVQAPSSTYLTIARHPRPASSFPKAMLAVVDPVFSRWDARLRALVPSVAEPADPGSSLPRLPFTDEIAAAERLIPRQRLVELRGFDATLDALRKLKLDDFGILHFSTHAEVDDHVPELSRIVLSLFDRGGNPIEQASLLPAQLGEFRLKNSIVSLSACRTAVDKRLADGDHLVGFSSSLFNAGASQLALTMTEVDAEASSAFFSAVYASYLSSGAAGIEHAVTEARGVLAKSSRWADPYHWAPYIVSGIPGDPIPVKER